MKRIDTSTRAIDLFGPGKDGFRDGDLASGVPPTDFNAAWPNNLQEEIANVVEAAGIALDGNIVTQLLRAIRRMVGGNVRTAVAGATALTADDAGVVLVDASGGAATLTLPAANALKGLPISIRRIDTGAAAVTINRAGADTIDEVGSSFSLNGRGDFLRLVSDGVAGWRSLSSQGSQLWQNVAGSRAMNTVYTNTTGRPIMVNVSCTLSVGGANAYLDINGLAIAAVGSGSNWAGAPATSVVAIVPAGATYTAKTTLGTGTVATWSELR